MSSRERSLSTIMLTGGTGFIGGALTRELRSSGARVIQLVRRPCSDPDSIQWHPESGKFDPPEPIDAVIHLAGESIVAGRWSTARKARIRESRVAVTARLAERLAKLSPRPKVLLCASAVGFYGDRGEEILDERSTPGSGFLADTCREWERAAGGAADRTVNTRFGVVLHPSGGALKKMLPAFRLGLGGPLGDGRQFMSWISLSDAVAALIFSLRSESIEGPVNVVAPEPVTNRDFTRALAGAIRRPAVLPVPKTALRILFGEMADAALLASQRVLPRRLLEAGFEFRDSAIEAALKQLA